MFAPLDDLESAIDKLAAAEGLVDLARLRRLADRLEAEWLRAVREHDRALAWAADDYTSPSAWLRATTGLAPGAARAAVHQSRLLDSFPLFADAFAAGEISRQHVGVLSPACTPERRAELQHLEPDLVSAARRFDPAEFRAIVRHVCGAIDGDDGTDIAEQEYRHREFFCSATFGGRFELSGSLPVEEGEILTEALETMMRADRTPDDTRTRTQRRADALIDMARHSLACAEPQTRHGHRTRPHITVVEDLEKLEGRAPLAVAHARAEFAHGGTVSAETLRRLTCDAKISRVLVDGDSQPLDVGRTHYSATPAIWRALVVRDRHCQWPGCTRSPNWCEAHHKTPFPHGPTSINNMILLCPRHHHAVHEGRKAPP